MKKVSPNLVKRSITAVVGGALLLSVLIEGGYWGVRLLALTISVMASLEFGSVFFKLKDRGLKKTSLVLAVLVFHLIDIYFDQIQYYSVSLLFTFLFAVHLISTRSLSQNQLKSHLIETLASGFALVYLGALPLLLVSVYRVAPNWIFFYLGVIWSGDIGAYLAGKTFGKHLLFPKVSPGKTVEGSLGGLGLSFILGLVLAKQLFYYQSQQTVMILTLSVYIFSQIGDLCESLVKRAVGTKDSGGLLPGHGGFMDRFDGVIFALPVFYLGLMSLV